MLRLLPREKIFFTIFLYEHNICFGHRNHGKSCELLIISIFRLRIKDFNIQESKTIIEAGQMENVIVQT